MRCWPAALLACCLACGRPGSAPPPAALVPWLRSDPQRCLLPRDLSEGMETMARHCAEAFVRENGYTELPAEDSTRWTREAGDDGPWVRVLAVHKRGLAAIRPEDRTLQEALLASQRLHAYLP